MWWSSAGFAAALVSFLFPWPSDGLIRVSQNTTGMVETSCKPNSKTLTAHLLSAKKQMGGMLCTSAVLFAVEGRVSL